MELNQNQIEVVNCIDNSLLVVAGAGTGKTRTIVEKISYFINTLGANPDSIIATTFTNKAAHELKERLIKKLGPIAEGVRVGTFHKISADIITLYGSAIGIDSSYTMISGEDQIQILRSVLTKEKLKDVSPSKLLDKIQKYKEGDLTYLTPTEKTVFNSYQANLAYSKVLDFSDLIILSMKIFTSSPSILNDFRDSLKLICVDEFQDINNSQYKWIKLIHSPTSQLCCVGDGDQAIYGFRNANAEYIINFEKYFPNCSIIKLETNYRSKQKLLESANSLIKCNKNRIDKNLVSHNQDAEEALEIKYFSSSKLEATSIVNGILGLPTDATKGILVRNKSQMQEIEESLVAANIGYKLIGSINFIDRAEIKDILAYLKFIHNKKDVSSFKRMIQAPKRGIGDTTIEKITLYGNRMDCDLLTAFEATVANLSKSYQDKFDEIKNLILEAENYKNLFSMANFIFLKSNYGEYINEEKKSNITQWVLSLTDYDSLADYIEKITWQDSNAKQTSTVNLMTIHASKGLEFDYVFLPGWEEGILPHGAEQNQNDIEEERRLAYVGLTRARYKAFISHVGIRFINGNIRNSGPSRFVKELKHVPINPYRPKTSFHLGARVIHTRFGTGYVLESSPTYAKVKFFDGIKLVDLNSIKNL